MSKQQDYFHSHPDTRDLSAAHPQRSTSQRIDLTPMTRIQEGSHKIGPGKTTATNLLASTVTKEATHLTRVTHPDKDQAPGRVPKGVHQPQVTTPGTQV